MTTPKKKKSWMSMFVEFEEPKNAPETNLAPEDMDSEDIAAMLAAALPTKTPSTEPVPVIPVVSAPIPVSSVPVSSGIVEGRSIEDVIREQGCVPPSPKSATEIIAFLDGLKTMPLAVQQQALKAMDDADANWTLDDAVLDAKNRKEALRRAKEGLGATMSAAATKATTDIAAQDQLIANATSTVNDNIANLKAQIAELETLRDSETSGAEATKTSIRSTLKTTQEACGREAARFDTESARLDHFITTFGPNAQGASS